VCRDQNGLTSENDHFELPIYGQLQVLWDED
jgi:hypothetical protein